VDRKILDGFKRRALKQYPKEYAEQLWGTVEGSKANICVIEPVDLTQQTRDGVDFDFDQRCGTKHSGMTLLGSIHTHPAPYDHAEPSAADISSSIHDKEIVWGVCGIRKTPKRRFFSSRFWSASQVEVELVVSE
jgi:proteasome lid subunit RPN8/RPN11